MNVTKKLCKTRFNKQKVNMIKFLILNVLDVFLKENYSITSFMGSLGPLLKMD